MDTILEDIKCIPGVSCVFCFDTRIGILCQKETPEAIRNSPLVDIGRTLSKIYAGGQAVIPDLQSLHLRLGPSDVITVGVTATHYLVIIHGPGLNLTLLSMTLVQSIKDLKTLLTLPEQAAPQNPGNLREEIKKHLEAAPTSKILAHMEKMLARIIGPMASLVFQETLEKWIESLTDPGRISLQKLAGMLYAEIGDPLKIKAYEQLIAPHLKAEE